MDLKRFITIGVLATLCSGIVPLAAFAEDGSDNTTDSEDTVDATEQTSEDPADDTSDDQSDDSVSDAESDGNAEDAEVDDEDEVYYDSAQEAEADDLQTQESGEVLVEQVDQSDLDEDAVSEYMDASVTGQANRTFLLSVRWGYFAKDGETAPSFDVTDWDGTVSFDNGSFALPLKQLRFETGEDSIDFDNTTAQLTTFKSDIHNSTDGILFKVKTNVDEANSNGIENVPSVTFRANSSVLGGLRVSLSYLLEEGEYTVTDGNYELKFNVWTPEEWVKDSGSAQTQVNSSAASDAETGAWYLQFMNYSLEHHFFSGYKNEKGELTGKIGPGDTLTRLQLLKVLYELSVNLNMGVATTSCDPSTVSTTSDTDWMGDNWARGYVQCIENSGTSVTLLSTIGSDVSKGQESAQRWEVIASAFQILGLDTTGATDTTLSDVSSSGLEAEFQDMLDKAVELGVISGYPDGTFKPYKTVNRAEMFKMVTLFYEVLSL